MGACFCEGDCGSVEDARDACPYQGLAASLGNDISVGDPRRIAKGNIGDA